MMACAPVDGNPPTARGGRRLLLLALLGLLTVLAMAMTATAQGEDLELANVTYTPLDGDGDGLDDSVRVNASVHNGNDTMPEMFTLEVVLEHGTTRVDLKTDGDRLDPNATQDLTILVMTDTSSPGGTYTVRVALHAGDLQGEVRDSDEHSVDLRPRGEYGLDIRADRTSAETLENTSVPFTLTVESLSNNPTGVTVVVGTSLGWSYQLDTEHLDLDPDGTAQVGLIVIVPPNATAGSREELTIEVWALRSTSAFASVSLSVTVAKQEFSVVLSLQTKEVHLASGETATIDGTVANHGNNLDNVTLTADAPDGWTVEFEPPFLLLVRGEERAFRLMLTAPANLKESGTSQMNITARSIGLVHESVVPITLVYNTAELSLRDGDLKLTPNVPVSGEEVTLQATIANSGSITAENILVVVVSNGKELDRTFVEDIPPGGLGVATLRWNAAPGSQLLRVLVDPDDDIAETEENDNEASMTMAVTSPDLAIAMRDITMDPGYPTEASDATIMVSVTNLAIQSAGPFDVHVSVDGTLFKTFTVDIGLVGGANVSLLAPWTAMAGRHEVSVVVDPEGIVPEEELSNNEASRSFSVNSRPVPSLDIHMPEVGIGEIVEMDASDSSDPDGRVRQYHFDYGDGTDSGWVFGATINHTYNQIGTYEVRVYVRDEAEAQSLEPAVVKVTVTEEGDGNGNGGNGTPGLPAWTAMTALALVAALTTVLGRRRKAGGR